VRRANDRELTIRCDTVFYYYYGSELQLPFEPGWLGNRENLYRALMLQYRHQRFVNFLLAQPVEPDPQEIEITETTWVTVGNVSVMLLVDGKDLTIKVYEKGKESGELLDYINWINTEDPS
jgi:hypothetical protein